MQHNKIILIGPMGAGKTSVGRLLAELLHFRFIDSDQLLTQQFQKSVSEIYAQHGVQYFREQERLLLENCSLQANVVLATGGGSILNANVREKLRHSGLICYLKVSPEQQVRRVEQCCHRPSVPVNLSQRLEFFNNMALQRNKLYDSLAEFQIDTDLLDIDSIVTRVMQYANRE